MSLFALEEAGTQPTFHHDLPPLIKPSPSLVACQCTCPTEAIMHSEIATDTTTTYYNAVNMHCTTFYLGDHVLIKFPHHRSAFDKISTHSMHDDLPDKITSTTTNESNITPPQQICFYTSSDNEKIAIRPSNPAGNSAITTQQTAGTPYDGEFGNHHIALNTFRYSYAKLGNMRYKSQLENNLSHVSPSKGDRNLNIDLVENLSQFDDDDPLIFDHDGPGLPKTLENINETYNDHYDDGAPLNRDDLRDYNDNIHNNKPLPRCLSMEDLHEVSNDPFNVFDQKYEVPFETDDPTVIDLNNRVYYIPTTPHSSQNVSQIVTPVSSIRSSQVSRRSSIHSVTSSTSLHSTASMTPSKKLLLSQSHNTPTTRNHPTDNDFETLSQTLQSIRKNAVFDQNTINMKPRNQLIIEEIDDRMESEILTSQINDIADYNDFFCDDGDTILIDYMNIDINQDDVMNNMSAEQHAEHLKRSSNPPTLGKKQEQKDILFYDYYAHHAMSSETLQITNKYQQYKELLFNMYGQDNDKVNENNAANYYHPEHPSFCSYVKEIQTSNSIVPNIHHHNAVGHHLGRILAIYEQTASSHLDTLTDNNNAMNCQTSSTLTMGSSDHKTKNQVIIYQLYRYDYDNNVIQTDIKIATNVFNIVDRAFILSPSEYLSSNLPHFIPSIFSLFQGGHQHDHQCLGCDGSLNPLRSLKHVSIREGEESLDNYITYLKTGNIDTPSNLISDDHDNNREAFFTDSDITALLQQTEFQEQESAFNRKQIDRLKKSQKKDSIAPLKRCGGRNGAGDNDKLAEDDLNVAPQPAIQQLKQKIQHTSQYHTRQVFICQYMQVGTDPTLIPRLFNPSSTSATTDQQQFHNTYISLHKEHESIVSQRQALQQQQRQQQQLLADELDDLDDNDEVRSSLVPSLLAADVNISTNDFLADSTQVADNNDNNNKFDFFTQLFADGDSSATIKLINQEFKSKKYKNLSTEQRIALKNKVLGKTFLVSEMKLKLREYLNEHALNQHNISKYQQQSDSTKLKRYIKFIKLNFFIETYFDIRKKTALYQQMADMLLQKYRIKSGEQVKMVDHNENNDDSVVDIREITLEKYVGRLSETILPPKYSGIINASIIPSTTPNTIIKQELTSEPSLLSLYKKSLEPGYLGVDYGESLKERENEYHQIHSFLSHGLHKQCAGGTLLVSGLPGTGKTATVQQVLDRLETDAKQKHVPPHTVIRLNATQLRDPAQIYPLLLQGLTINSINTVNGNMSKAMASQFENPKVALQTLSSLCLQKKTTVVINDSLNELRTRTPAKRGRKPKQDSVKKKKVGIMADFIASESESECDSDVPIKSHRDNHIINHDQAPTQPKRQRGRPSRKQAAKIPPQPSAQSSDDEYDDDFDALNDDMFDEDNDRIYRSKMKRRYRLLARGDSPDDATSALQSLIQLSHLSYCIFIIDEADYLISNTEHQKELYQLLDFPSNNNLPLSILLISNTFNLWEKSLRILSRIGLKQLSFDSYTLTNIQQIIATRLRNANVQFVRDLFVYYKYFIYLNLKIQNADKITYYQFPSHIDTVNINARAVGEVNNENEAILHLERVKFIDLQFLQQALHELKIEKNLVPSCDRSLTMANDSLQLIELLQETTAFTFAELLDSMVMLKYKQSHGLIGLDADSIRFISAKVAQLSGDCRKALNITSKSITIALNKRVGVTDKINVDIATINEALLSLSNNNSGAGAVKSGGGVVTNFISTLSKVEILVLSTMTLLSVQFNYNTKKVYNLHYRNYIPLCEIYSTLVTLLNKMHVYNHPLVSSSTVTSSVNTSARTISPGNIKQPQIQQQIHYDPYRPVIACKPSKHTTNIGSQIPSLKQIPTSALSQPTPVNTASSFTNSSNQILQNTHINVTSFLQLLQPCIKLSSLGVLGLLELSKDNQFVVYWTGTFKQEIVNYCLQLTFLQTFLREGGWNIIYHHEADHNILQSISNAVHGTEAKTTMTTTKSMAAGDPIKKSTEPKDTQFRSEIETESAPNNVNEFPAHGITKLNTKKRKALPTSAHLPHDDTTIYPTHQSNSIIFNDHDSGNDDKQNDDSDTIKKVAKKQKTSARRKSKTLDNHLVQLPPISTPETHTTCHTVATSELLKTEEKTAIKRTTRAARSIEILPSEPIIGSRLRSSSDAAKQITTSSPDEKSKRVTRSRTVLPLQEDVVPRVLTRASTRGKVEKEGESPVTTRSHRKK